MLTRAISGAIYVLLIIGAILAPGSVCFYALMTLFIILGMIELQHLLSSRAPMSLGVRICDLLFAVVFISACYFTLCHFTHWSLLGLTLLYVPVRMIVAVCDRTEQPAKSILYSFLTMMYVAWPLTLLFVAYAMGGMAPKIVLMTFILIWVNDTGAYLSGMSMGRHKLCERLSPKKTWEGFWGGFVLSIGAGVLGAWLMSYTGQNLVLWGVYAALVSLVGTFGDLFESLIKRTLGVKDSGKLIPGHGGILDRIDSVLAVAPLVLVMVFVM